MTRHYTEDEAVAAVGRLTVTRLRAFVAADCVTPALGEQGPVFSDADLARLDLLCDLAEDFGLEEDALALVVSLVDQLHGLRRELRALAEALESEPEEVRARVRAAYRRASGR